MMTSKEKSIIERQSRNDLKCHSSINHISKEMAQLCHSIETLSDRSKSSTHIKSLFADSNSTLGKLYQYFLSISDEKPYLLQTESFHHLIHEAFPSYAIPLHRIQRTSLNFIQFLRQIEQIARENQLPKEYLYEKVCWRRSFPFSIHFNSQFV